jgi:hypothetical protein
MTRTGNLNSDRVRRPTRSPWPRPPRPGIMPVGSSHGSLSMNSPAGRVFAAGGPNPRNQPLYKPVARRAFKFPSNVVAACQWRESRDRAQLSRPREERADLFITFSEEKRAERAKNDQFPLFIPLATAGRRAIADSTQNLNTSHGPSLHPEGKKSLRYA